MTNAAIKLFEVPYQEGADVKIIEGIPASPGVAEGRARVISRYEDLYRVKTDTILVCPRMSPDMTIVFSDAKGIVTNHGGASANAAIVARECGIPAVAGTSSATEDIEDGDYIVVDGTMGRVEIIRKDAC